MDSTQPCIRSNVLIQITTAGQGCLQNHINHRQKKWLADDCRMGTYPLIQFIKMLVADKPSKTINTNTYIKI